MRSDERRRFGSALPLKIVLLGLGLSVAAAFGWIRWWEMRVANRIAMEAADLEAKVRTRIETHLALLHGTTGLFAVNPNVTRADFHRYMVQVGVPQNYPGLQGLGFSRYAPSAGLPDLLLDARRNGWTDFRVWPEDPRDEYHAIVFLEPEDERNRAAVGYDMHTNPVRRAAMDAARDSGEAVMSGKVTLVQEIDEAKQAGFLVYVPVYAGGDRPETIAERRARLRGFVYAPFRAGDFMASVTDGTDADIGLVAYDEPRRSASMLFAREPETSLGWRPVRKARGLDVANRRWTIVYSAPGSDLLAPLGILLGGFAVSGVAALLVRRERNSRRRAERSEATTRERERELSLLVEWVPAVVTYADSQGILRVCNQRYRELFGEEPDAAIGRPLREAFGVEAPSAMESAVARALAGEPVAIERWHKIPGRGARYLALNYVPLRTPAGRPNGFYSLISDLTALKRAEERARFIADCGKLLISSLDYESMARGLVHLAVPQIADMAVLFRFDKNELCASTAAHAEAEADGRLADVLRRLRWPRDAEHGVGLAARRGVVVITPDVREADLDRAAVSPEERALLERLEVCSAMHVPVVVRGQVWAVFSFATSARSGRRFTDEDRSLAEEISTRVRLAVENALLYAAAQEEIEERRRAQRAARETEERFRLLVAGARDYAIILIDPRGRIESWNEGAERIFGFGEPEAVGLPLARLSSDEDRGAVEDELGRAREHESALDERWYVRKDGTRFWASGHTVALRDDEHQIRGYAKIMRDLTDRKMMEEELERRVQERTTELNEAVQELEAFSYSVSHDLRSPLRSIRGFTELALEEAGARLTETERGYLERAQRAISRLDRLISDLLAYTRVSKTKVELGPVDLHTLVSDIRREHPEFQPPRADVRIEGDLLPVIGHETYLTQALTNLLGNAVKFVKAGEKPAVRIWTERHEDRVRLFVRDNGIGIPAQHVHRAFEMFERLHPGSGYEGTGVGLAIVRRAVQRMHGTAGVESAEGVGTTFWIELPEAGRAVGNTADQPAA